jgi:hypothetical protein
MVFASVKDDRQNFRDNNAARVAGPGRICFFESQFVSLYNSRMKFLHIPLVLLLLSVPSCKSEHASSIVPGEKRIALPKGAPSPQDLYPLEDGRHIVYRTARNSSGVSEVDLFDLPQGSLSTLGHFKLASILTFDKFRQFVVVESGEKSKHLTVFESNGNRQSEFDIPGGGYGCDGTIDLVLVCETDLPGLTEDSPDYDPLGFTAVQIVDLQTKKVRLFPTSRTQRTANVRYVDGKIYASDLMSENNGKLSVIVYDLTGRTLKNLTDLHGILFSPNRRYYLPNLHEEPLPWEIYDASTNQAVRRFNAEQTSVTKIYYDYGEWNPTKDD